MENMNFAECHLLTDKVNIYLNVFSMSMLNWIGGHVDCKNIVTVDNCCTLRRSMELDKKLTKPNRFSNNIGNREILSFGEGPGD
jgi:hypothetical protein